MLTDPLVYKNVAAAATAVIRTGAGRVYSATCHNSNAAARYLQLFDLAVVPTTTVTVPTETFLVPSGAQIIIGSDYFTTFGLPYTTGLAWAFSTTRDVYTAGSAADQQTHVYYI